MSAGHCAWVEGGMHFIVHAVTSGIEHHYDYLAVLGHICFSVKNDPGRPVEDTGQGRLFAMRRRRQLNTLEYSIAKIEIWKLRFSESIEIGFDDPDSRFK